MKLTSGMSREELRVGQLTGNRQVQDMSSRNWADTSFCRTMFWFGIAAEKTSVLMDLSL